MHNIEAFIQTINAITGPSSAHRLSPLVAPDVRFLSPEFEATGKEGLRAAITQIFAASPMELYAAPAVQPPPLSEITTGQGAKQAAPQSATQFPTPTQHGAGRIRISDWGQGQDGQSYLLRWERLIYQGPNTRTAYAGMTHIMYAPDNGKYAGLIASITDYYDTASAPRAPQPNFLKRIFAR